MSTFQVTTQIAYLGQLLQKVKEYSGSLVQLIQDESVADSQTDFEITVALDVSAVKCFALVSSETVTLETNDGTTPANTLSLVADKMYQWDTDAYDAFLLDTDVTSVFITNASGAAALINMWALLDPSP